jgi:intracellular septation protein A
VEGTLHISDVCSFLIPLAACVVLFCQQPQQESVFKRMCGKMTNEKSNAKDSLLSRSSLMLSIFFFGLYIVNVFIGKANIVFNWEIFHLGNVGEFLILLSASIAFIVCALHKESLAKRNSI